MTASSHGFEITYRYAVFLQDFLESAEQYFIVGFRVHYYVFTDHPEQVPDVKLGEGHKLTVMTVNSSSRWQEMSLGRMKRLEMLIESGLVNDADLHLFSLDVDTKFYGHWGAETLGNLVGVIHAWFYNYQRVLLPYERRPESQEFIPYSEGDYYYFGAVLGGSVKCVYQLAKTCREQLDIDAAKSIEAAWQEESHLNKYFLYNKPSKLLSPEYSWDDKRGKPEEINIIRFSQVLKNCAEVRPNTKLLTVQNILQDEVSKLLEQDIILDRSRRAHGQPRLCSFVKRTSVRHFRHYLAYPPFTIITDHKPLVGLKKLPLDHDPTGRRARWAVELDLYEWVLIDDPANKHNKLHPRWVDPYEDLQSVAPPGTLIPVDFTVRDTSKPHTKPKVIHYNL
ncbi:globoside alpha-1,3-N-acetylgalactosaminyltransferase 1-like [Danio aesculapii]|uniref:globoside alpha-1,3-N-acetylgalactosaminyltransferase 1-like n=1 Tax=Danio aesculapii TaxID=1142201 RepID=UPI0024BF9A6A|nr:globoside alpha-1,3-N-acetylgalactosaminyltransferase 1-like [Danio aesculapii]